VPVTGREQLSLVPDETMLAASYQQFQQFLRENQVVEDAGAAAGVERAGRRIAQAVERFMASSRQPQEFAWEFKLIKNEQVNAFAMPGGKVVVYTGILPIAQDEGGLAAIMAHEIGHVIAKHSNERMSQVLLTELGGTALSAALSQQPVATQRLLMTAFGAGAQYGVLLPYSRLQESEADRLGLIFMAMAGYDPHAALGLWQRMSESRQGPSPPEFLSTHPADQTRIENIRKALPEALSYSGRGA